jgi:hypothetical protein
MTVIRCPLSSAYTVQCTSISIWDYCTLSNLALSISVRAWDYLVKVGCGDDIWDYLVEVVRVWAFDDVRDYLVKVGRVDQCLRIWRCMGLTCQSWPCWSVSEHLTMYGITLSKLAVLISVQAFDEVWDYLVEVGRVDQFLRIWQCMGLPCRSWPCRSVSEHLTMYGINLSKLAV